MHHAPSVSYPVGRPVFVARLLVAVWLMGSVVTVITASLDAPAWRHLLSAVALALPALLGWRFWRGMPVGLLRWDGQAWHGPAAPDQPLSLHVQRDGQRYLLVRLMPLAGEPGAARPAGRGPAAISWLWLDGRMEPSRWQDVRRAAFASMRDAGKPVATAA